MQKKFAMYLRVSTLEQARNGYGLGDQEVQCRKYMDLYYPNEKDNVEIYKDDGFSAKDLDRPEMARMMKDVKDGKIHTIIAFKLDRLSRNVIDVYNLIQTVANCDCNIIAVVDHIDISSANGRMLIGILSVISQWEREAISERTLAGLSEMVRKGKYPYGGKPPFGWDRTDGLLRVNRRNAEILNYMANLYIKGYSLKDISERVQGKYGQYFWWKHIKELLLRKINVGEFEYHGEVYFDVVPAIFTDAQYEEILEKAKYREIHRPDKIEYTFHGQVYCSCGTRLQQVCTVKHRTDDINIYRYYYCEKCKRNFSQIKLEKDVFAYLTRVEYTNRINDYRDEMSQKIHRLEEKKENTYKLFMSNILSDKMYAFTISNIEDSIRKLDKQLKKINLDIIDFKSMDQQTKYNYAHGLISRIEVDLNTKTIISIQLK